MKQDKVTITIKLHGQQVELNIEEAKDLYDQLNFIFGKEKQINIPLNPSQLLQPGKSFNNPFPYHPDSTAAPILPRPYTFVSTAAPGEPIP